MALSLISACLPVSSTRYLEQANIVFINPAEFIQEPKKVRTLPRNILTPAEARQVLDQPNLGTLKGIRDRAILELFYSTGIRIEELCSLTIYDADLQGGMVRITKGKGKKDRVVPMGKHAVRFLREYITRVRPHYTRNNRTTRRLFIDAFDTTGTLLANQLILPPILTRNAGSFFRASLPRLTASEAPAEPRPTARPASFAV